MAALRQQLQQHEQIRMLEPRARQRPERRLVLGQLADDVGLGTRMRQYVQKVIYDNREIGIVDALYVVDELAPRLRTHQFVEGPAPPFATRCQLTRKELLLVLVLAALLVIVEPLVGHEFVDGKGHQARKDRIARILRGRRQDRTVEVVDLNVVIPPQQRTDRPPLVVTEIVDQKQRRTAVRLHVGKDLLAHERVRHDGYLLLVHTLVDPVVVVAAHELAELLIGLALLIYEHLLDTLVHRVREVDLPPRDLAVERAPCPE